ncbi:hypothetical protein K227x_51160 [Rubripirellula lacrimiformis]|uniref:Uncharacterized protein n=1 Tax=Rubripirellula lacrimiformis TaxID=1930273 RepID=A0A517NHU1_9BACT|nr:hypothetical protein [Rubripirellula lacrimiformis]QDT06700.1 hypothetical protein K227x_51160 [Rubripirellula lacrimiformis]
MSASNRASLIGKLQTALKKHYTALPAQPTRPLLEHLLYASLLQDAPADLADEGMAKCEQEFFDWNEVRVTSVTELTQVLSRLPDAPKAAGRLKSNLQSIFEEFYTFDLDHLKKENLGKAVGKFEKMPGMTPFVLNYTVQHGLAGHAIPIDYSAMVIMLATEIASQPEAMSGKVPGLERAIPKSKGIEFAGLLHQCAVALNKNLKDKTARTVLESVSKGSGDRLDEWMASKKAAKKRVVKRKTQEKAEAVEAAKVAEQEALTSPKKKPAKKAAAKKPVAPPTPAPAEPEDAQKSASSKKSVAPKAAKESAKPAKKPVSKKSTPAKAEAPKDAAKKETKKPSTKKSASKAEPAKGKTSSKKSDNRKLTKSKPR